MNAEKLEVQTVNYSREYELDLGDYNQLDLSFQSEEDRKLFEDVLICKIYGISYKLTGESTIGSIRGKHCNTHTVAVAFDLYDRIEYGLMYGSGAESRGDVSKCVFGITHDFKAYKNNSVVLSIPEPYFFVFAHRDGLDGEADRNVLRAHKIMAIPNSEFIFDPDTAKKGNYGLVTKHTTPSMILGFNWTETYLYFHLPQRSYCLEGRSEDVIDMGDAYPGKFKVVLPTQLDN